MENSLLSGMINGFIVTSINPGDRLSTLFPASIFQNTNLNIPQLARVVSPQSTPAMIGEGGGF